MNKKISLLLVFVLCINIVIFAQNEDLDSKVDKYIQWMTRDNNPNIWGAAGRLEELGTSAVPIIKRKLYNLPNSAKLGCVKALINLGELDYSQQQLLAILKKESTREDKISSLSMLENIGDFELEGDLLKILENSFDPYFKIALAKALWRISRAPESTDILKSFLRVDDFKIQAQAALALGEIGNVKAALPILNILKEQPTEEGRLAQVLVKQDSLINRYEMLLDSQGGAKKTSKEEKYPLIDEVINKIHEYHVDGDKHSDLELLNQAVEGMVASTDIHSAFWTEKEWDDFVKTTVNEEYVGIGVYVGDKDGQFTIISPIYSGPAFKAGIRSLDIVMEVNGWSTSGQTMDEIISRIKGVGGTSVKLKVYRKGWSKPREIEVPREKIKVPSLFVQMLPSHIGYIRLTQFGRKATEDMEDALVKLEKQGMKAFILDLRGNGGGWLQVAVDIIDKFLGGNKLAVYSEGRHSEKGKKYEYYTTNKATHPDFPMIILVDGSSASASEIVSGTLQYYKRAVIVGEQTFGKGSVQEPLELETRPGARLKLTIALYYLPDGRCIHNIMDKDGKVIQHNGIIPDVKVTYDDWETWKNEELAKLEEEKVFDNYLDKYFSQYKDKFTGLAENDQLDYNQYPNFEEWYNSLKTKANKNDIRYWLRAKIRGKVSDEKGQQYACDYVEDVMLQQGIWELLQKMNLNIKDVQEYSIFKDKFK